MRTAMVMIVFLSGACGGTVSSGGSVTGAGDPAAEAGKSSNAAVWWRTCGMPSCSGPPWPESGLPYCPGELEGTACATTGAECDPRGGCEIHLLCSATDPKPQDRPGCPISRARFKKDIHYLSPDELRARSRELLDLPLASYRYRNGDERSRLGFMIDGHESLACVDGDRVDLYGYTSMAVAALQIQAQQIAELRDQLAAVQKELAKRRR
jgi:hypothetical protein